jgi:hypothetical protein
MKSSKDIQPRVGMQVRLYDGRSKNIIEIRPDAECAIRTSDGCDWFAPDQKQRCHWNGGAVTIEWTPPTDDERRLFMEAARHWSGVSGDCRDDGPCDWATLDCPGDCEDAARVFESLALDGADYDNMPDFEELER